MSWSPFDKSPRGKLDNLYDAVSEKLPAEGEIRIQQIEAQINNKYLLQVNKQKEEIYREILRIHNETPHIYKAIFPFGIVSEVAKELRKAGFKVDYQEDQNSSKRSTTVAWRYTKMWDLQSRLTPLFNLDLEGATELWEELNNLIVYYNAHKNQD